MPPPAWAKTVSSWAALAAWAALALLVLVVVWDLVAVALFPGATISAVTLESACRDATKALVGGVLVGAAVVGPVSFVLGHLYWPQGRG